MNLHILHTRFQLTCAPNALRILAFLTLISCTHTSMSQSFDLVGVGTLSEFGVDTMAFKFERGEADAAQLSVRFLQPRSTRRWGQFWSQNLTLNHDIGALSDQFDDIYALTDALKGGLEAGDLLTLRQGNNSSWMLLNGVALTQFSNPSAVSFFMTALTGPVPPSSVLKQQLLATDSSELLDNIARFDSTQFSLERAQAIATWGAAPAEETLASNSLADTDALQVIEPEQDSVLAQVQETPRGDLTADAASPEPTDQADLLAATLAAAEAERLAQAEAERLAADAEAARLAAIAEEQRLANEAARAKAQERLLALDKLEASHDYTQYVQRRVYEHISYPRSAQRQGRQGVIRVAVDFLPDGSINEILLVESTQYRDLNDAAIESIEAGIPYNPLPEILHDDFHHVEFPIVFRLQD